MAKLLKFVFIALTLASLAAILICSLSPSPNMRETWWIPSWLGEWADRNGNFRNFPVFAGFAALLFFALRSLELSRVSKTETTRGAAGSTALRVAVCASALGVLLEVTQLLFLSSRHFDWADIGWSTSGAFVGAFACAFLVARSLRSA